MNRNLTNLGDHNQYIPTIQSIDAQSQFSVDLKQTDLDPLLTKIFMLCIELERKDIIIEELQSEAHRGQLRKSQVDITHRQLLHRYEKLEHQYRAMIQNNALLKNDIMNLQKNLRQLEVYKSNSIFNQELEEKVRTLENKFRRSQEQKIELIENEKNLKRQLSMLSYNVIKTSEKNKIRELEHELSQERAKFQSEKRVSSQQKFLLEKYTNEIKSLKESENKIVRSYQEKISLIRTNEDLRKSQISIASEEKVCLMAQEMNRLKEDIDYLRRELHEEKNKVSDRDDEIRKLHDDLKCMQIELKQFQGNYGSIQQDFQKKQEHLLIQLDKFQKENKYLQNNCKELEYFLKQKTIEESQKTREVQRLREEVQALESQRTQIKNNLRKAKRQSIMKNGSGECQVCKARASNTSLASGKRLNQLLAPVDFDDIIKQTEKLKQSNKKVESLISHHEISSQHSIEHRQSLTHVHEGRLVE